MFNNAGDKVIFDDEWGGGSQPRCRAEDPMTWGADSIFTLKNKELTLGAYYKMPAPQTDKENCTAHNGSIVPIPGRDIEARNVTGGMLRAGPLAIDISKHAVNVNNESVNLTLTEFKLLAALLKARGRVLTRHQLMDKAMGADVFVTDRAIDVHVTAIRKKLGEASWLIHTVRGVGYRLQDSTEES